MNVRAALAALLGLSAYTQAPANAGPSLGDEQVETIRKAMGGQIAPLPTTNFRWYLADIETAQRMADSGDLSRSAQLMRSCRGDGVIAGVSSTRTEGLVRLPKRFRGDAEMVSALELGGESVHSVFDAMCPPSELAAMAWDGITLGVGIGELVPVDGRDYKILIRLDPEFLVYRWNENRWYYSSIAGILPITPGDGRWVLHIPGGRLYPWNGGIWRALAASYIRKTHAALHKDNWEAKLANPARVAVAPQAASEVQKESWFRRVMAWGINTVFGLTPGYDVKLLESNGRGHEAWEKTVERCDREAIIALAGQVVTTDGGAGFSNSDIHRSIRADLIQSTAAQLAHTINTQVIPAWVIERWGEDALAGSPCVAWDVTPPKDLATEANSLLAVANAIKGLTEALTQHNAKLDVATVCSRFGVPILGDADGDGQSDTAPDEDAPKLQAMNVQVLSEVAAHTAHTSFMLMQASGPKWDEDAHPRRDDGKFGSGDKGGDGDRKKADGSKKSRAEQAQEKFDITGKKAAEVAKDHAEAVDTFLNVERHQVSKDERDGVPNETSDKINAFLRAAKKGGAEYTRQTYRGVSEGELNRILDGGTNTSTWSVSKDPEGAAHFAKKGGVLLVLPGKCGAIPMDHVDGSNTYNEALVPKGTKWKVKSDTVKDGVRVVQLEVDRGQGSKADAKGLDRERISARGLGGEQGLKDAWKAKFGTELTNTKQITDMIGVSKQRHPKDAIHVTSDPSGRLSVEYESKGVSIWRKYLGDDSVFHGYLYLDRDLQDKGLGTEIIREQLKQYKKAGIKNVSLVPSEIGKYLWPKYGFTADEQHTKAALSEFRSYLADKGIKLRKNLTSLQDIARAKHKGVQVGKDFLLRSASSLGTLSSTVENFDKRTRSAARAKRSKKD